MGFSEMSYNILALCRAYGVKSPAQFWRQWRSGDDVLKSADGIEGFSRMVEEVKGQVDSYGVEINATCAFDGDFPLVNAKAKGVPYILFYRGDISLIKRADKNVAVIGTTSPTGEIEEREGAIVKTLVAGGMNVISGLAIGCDSRAHKTCIEEGGKTVAILPCTLKSIYPACNRGLAEQIAKGGGLLLTEYFDEPEGRREAVNRFIGRDRLQALFSKAVVMMASYSRGKGGSGSRHAMEYAQKIGVPRYALSGGESGEKLFGLNREYFKNGEAEQIDEAGAQKIAALPAPFQRDISGGLPDQLAFF